MITPERKAYAEAVVKFAKMVGDAEKKLDELAMDLLHDDMIPTIHLEPPKDGLKMGAYSVHVDVRLGRWSYNRLAELQKKADDSEKGGQQ